ncbi:hypothetical protein ACHAXT_000598 [Thalassiosira profunda]
MGRLLQNQLNVVAAPERAAPEMENNQMLDDHSEPKYNGYGWQHFPPSPQTNGDPTMVDMIDAPSSPEAAQPSHEKPRPLEDPYFQRQRQLFHGYYRQNKAPNGSSNEQQPVAQPVARPNSEPPRGETEIFAALNQQIEALDQQMQTPNSLQDGTGDIFYELESEWEYAQDGYYETNGEFSPQYQVGSEEYSSPQTQYEYVEANESVYAPEQQYFGAANRQGESYEANGQYEINNELNTNEAALRQELERLAAEKRVAEEAAARAEQELRERKRLEWERQQQERTTAAQAEAARAELKKALQREMARYEEEKRTQQPSSIVRSKRIHNLPETRDPFELLGLDPRNPPKSTRELRKAFLAMAKKYHPDAVASDATEEERETASLNFARINSAHQFIKRKMDMWNDQFFATTTTGGSMYEEPRNSHIRQPFSRGYGFDGFGSIFSGSSNGPNYGEQQQQPPTENNPNPFKRVRRDVGNCHVNGEEWY